MYTAAHLFGGGFVRQAEPPSRKEWDFEYDRDSKTILGEALRLNPVERVQIIDALYTSLRDVDDRLKGGPGDDTLVGGPDFDLCAGNVGTDTLATCEGVVWVPYLNGQQPNKTGKFQKEGGGNRPSFLGKMV